MVDWLPILLFAAAGLNVFLGLVVLTRDWRRLVNRVFFVLTLTVGLWDIGIGAFILVESNAQAFAWAQLFYASALLLVLLLVYFAQTFPNQKSLSPKSALLFALPVFVLVALIYVWPGFVIEKLYVTEHGRGVAVHQAPYFVYSLVVITYFAASLYKLFTKSQKSKGIYHRQAWWFFIAGSVTATIGLWFDLILPHWLGNYSLVWIGPLATTVFAVSSAIVIIRYGLFDIRLATMRAIAYTLTILTLATIYFILALIITDVLLRERSDTSLVASIVNVSVALVLAFIFQPIKRFFDRVTNSIFFQDAYDPGEFFARITKKLSTITDIYPLLRYTSLEVSTTLKAEFGAFLIHQTGTRPIFISTGKHASIPVQDTHVLDEYIEAHGNGVIITSLLDSEHYHLRRVLISHKIGLALHVLHETGIKGYLFLGEHRSSNYTKKDVKALETIADELGIAIHNSLLLHEVKSLNSHLEQRINSATKELRASNAQLQRLDEAKDEFISMASHQLRTPLTSIKGYISMIVDGDVGKVSDQQKKMLEEAFVSSERMVRLINDFLNVSRLQTGKFIIEKRDTDLAKVVKQEIESLEQNAKTHNLKFSVSVPKKMPLLFIDEGKIRQVIMNFADNAIYYSKEKSAVKVSLKVDKQDVWFKVTDTGIGVPELEQAELFSKFFRATNARRQRPDGTGVGLYLAKRVIQDHHGEVFMQSKEGKGSTFGFRLPLEKLRSSDKPK